MAVFRYLTSRCLHNGGKMYLNKSLNWMIMLALLAMLVFSACTTTSSEPVTLLEQVTADEPTQAELEAQIEEIVWAYEEAYEKGDLDKLMAFYADDVVSLPPGFPKSEGKAELEAAFREYFDAFTIERDFELVSVDVSGNTANRLGEWTQTLTPKDGGEPIVEVGRCVLDFEKQGDEWKIDREIWNTESVTIGELAVE
jgi:ketosteroid isomerase-like protein